MKQNRKKFQKSLGIVKICDIISLFKCRILGAVLNKADVQNKN